MIIPRQISHLVTSNSIEIFEKSKISKSIVQIDPGFVVKPKEKNIVTVSDLQQAKKNKYAAMSIEKINHGFLVTDPPFGRSYVILAKEECRIGEFASELRKVVDTKMVSLSKSQLDYWQKLIKLLVLCQN